MSSPSALDAYRQAYGQEPPSPTAAQQSGGDARQAYAQAYGQAPQEPEAELEGAPLGVRREASVPVTRQGKLNVLRKRYGEKNVTDKGDEIEIRDPATGIKLTLDPQPKGGVSWEGVKSLLSDLPGDLADLYGDALEYGYQAAGTITGGIGGAAAGSAVPGIGNVMGATLGSVAGVGSGAIAGRVARQAEAEALGADEQLSAGERVQDAALAANSAMSAEMVGPLVGAARKGFDPRNWSRAVAQSGGDPRMMAQANEITRATGIELTPGQASGSRTQLRIEGTLAQKEGAGDIMFSGEPGTSKGYMGQARQFEDFARKIARGGRSSETAGEALGAASQKVFDTLRASRREQAAQAFGEVERLAGSEPVIPLKNTIATASEILRQYEPALGPATAKRFANALVGDLAGAIDKGREQLIREAQERGASEVEINAIAKASALRLKGLRADAMQFQRAMADIGERLPSRIGAAASLDPKVKDQIAAKLLGAMRRDLDAAADMGELNGEVAAALKNARQAYAQASKELDDSKTRLLRDAIGLAEDDAPDVAIRNMVTNKSSVQIKRAMQVLQKYDKSAALHARQDALAEAFRKAKPGQAMAARGLEIGPVQFYRFAKQHEDNFRALFTGDRKGYHEFKMLVSAAERMADNAGVASGGAQTKLLDWFGGTIDLGVTAVTSRKTAIEKVATTITAERLARAMTVGGAKDLLRIMEMKASRQRKISEFSKLAATWALDEDEE